MDLETDHRNTYYDSNGGLVGVYFYQKGTLLSGMGYDNTVNCIEMSEKFFLKLGYKEFYKTSGGMPQIFLINML